jgi:3-hydroxyisobutyrate dehydrogenase-like beta-hydroxyacid dehydrogenase
MGGPIGGHLLAAGRPLAVYDPIAEACEPLVQRGATQAASPAGAAAASDLLLVVVVDDAQARAAVTEALAGAQPGSVIAVCASVRPDTCRELAQLGAEHDVHVIDAAMVRGERGAEEGRLVLYCGGPEGVIDAVQEACEPFTEAVVRVGDVGSGQVAKTANNILLWVCLRADLEAQRLGRALGVEPRTLREALAVGSGANRPLAEWGQQRLRWPQKDLEVALAVAADVGVQMPLVEQLPALMEKMTVEEMHELL